MTRVTIYVFLPEEAVDVWRPVDAELVAPGVYRITSPDPDPANEVWEFRSGDVVRCESRRLEGGDHPVAVAKADSDNKDRAKQIKSEIEAVRGILNEWNPIGVECPPDEYDCLVDQIVSALHRGATEEGISALITSDVRDHFGLSVRPVEVSRVAQEVATWWKAKHGA